MSKEILGAGDDGDDWEDPEAPVEEVVAGLTKGQLVSMLRDFPDDAEICVESVDNFDCISGGVYFPKSNSISLVGQNTEIEIDPDDFDSAVPFGDIELFDESEDGDGDSGTVIEGEFTEIVESNDTSRVGGGEIEAPARPAPKS